MKWILILLFSLQAHATDGWYCQEDSAKRTGAGFAVCGLGQGLDEGTAREKALIAAFREFNLLCQASYDCRDRETSVNPQRTTCKQDQRGVWQCWRLVEISVKPK